MSDKKYGFVPPIDTKAGACLTAANWQEVGVSALSCFLEPLLFKPGMSLLKQLKGLSPYMGWSQTFVIKGSVNSLKEGPYSLRSPYDGSILRLELPEYMQVINQLAPDYFVIPEAMGDLYPVLEALLSEDVFPLIAASARHEISWQRAFGVYFTPAMFAASPMSPSEQRNTYKNDDKNKPFAWIGEADSATLKELIRQGAIFAESERPLKDAYDGWLYTAKGTVNLTAPAMANQFSVIDASCACPTCEQEFTCAYLHHLLQHTPLLCHRYLIQHNVYQVQHMGRL